LRRKRRKRRREEEKEKTMICLLTTVWLSCEETYNKIAMNFLISFHHPMHKVRNLLNYNDSLSTDGTDETE
jgi:hypothetical protein